MNTIYVVIPCFNEQEVLPETSLRIKEKLMSLISQEKISSKSRVVLVDDGSSDTTWDIISNLSKDTNIYIGLKLSQNEGHQNALSAGLSFAHNKADAVISMDADLQDDINTIDKFIEKFETGCDIVTGVRSSRKKDSFFKRNTAQWFYKFMSFMGVKLIYNHADFRLLSNRALGALLQYKEYNLFLRGIIPKLGFKTCSVYYERTERFAGESKYPISKMLHLAFDGITSFSIKPIRMITLIGFICFLISIAMFIYTLVGFSIGKTTLGWPSLIISIWALGGLILLSLGIIGEYIGKIYLETKCRPKFIVEKTTESEES